MRNLQILHDPRWKTPHCLKDIKRLKRKNRELLKQVHGYQTFQVDLGGHHQVKGDSAARQEKSTPRMDSRVLGLEKSTPRMDSRVLEKSTPRMDSRVLGLEKSTPRMDSRVLGLEKSTPRMDSRVLGLEKSTPRMDSRVLVLEKSTPRMDSRVLGVQEEDALDLSGVLAGKKGLMMPPAAVPSPVGVVVCHRPPETSYLSVTYNNDSPEPCASPRKRLGETAEIKAIQQTRRLLANARERTRVHTISAAFEALRKQVPCYSYGQKLSKLAILRIACNYILSLAKLADLDYSADHSNLSFAECVDQCTRTLQSEGRSKKRKE